MASINELTILSNLEHTNALLLKDGTSKEDRLKILQDIAQDQKKRLDEIDVMKSIKKEHPDVYLPKK